MERCYRIGEVVKDLGLGQYTLKHYERNGLITPQVDEESGYRYYDYRDFGRLIIIRELRRLGFSVEEVVELVKANVASTMELYQERIEKNQQEIARLQEANELLSRRLMLVEEWSGKLGSWEKAVMPPIEFHSHFTANRAERGRAGDGLRDPQSWKDSYERGLIAIKMSPETLNGESDVLEWGFVTIDSLFGRKEPGETLAVWQNAEPGRNDCALVAYVRLQREENQAPSLRHAAQKVLSEAKCDAVADILAVTCDIQDARDSGGGIEALFALCIPVEC